MSADFSTLNATLDSLKEALIKSNSCIYLPKLYGIYTHFDDIDFHALPNAFTIKTNHDCGGVVIVKDKSRFLLGESLTHARAKITQHLQNNYYWQYREWHYKDIKPYIFIEELLGLDINDFRFHCFNGAIGFIQVADATHTHNDVFDIHWQELPFSYLNPKSSRTPTKPQHLDTMLHIAQILSAGFDYMRVDLYSIDSRIYVGELTFTPNGGLGTFEPFSFDMYFGDLWEEARKHIKTYRTK